MNDNDYITILPKRDLKTSQYKESMSENNLKRVLQTSQYKELMDKKDLKRGLKTSQYKESMSENNLKRVLKTSQYKKSMDKKDPKKLSKSQLIKLLLKRDSVNKPVPPRRTGKWESIKPKQMVKEYEDIIQLPEQFRDKQRPPKMCHHLR